MYDKFIEHKKLETIDSGFNSDESFYPMGIKDHQRVSVTWACKRGRAALFFDAGLGKTLAQLAWAEQVYMKTEKPVLILAPLAVSHQTVREGEKFGITVHIVKHQDDIKGAEAATAAAPVRRS